jgi:hypothetical protein
MKSMGVYASHQVFAGIPEQQRRVLPDIAEKS